MNFVDSYNRYSTENKKALWEEVSKNVSSPEVNPEIEKSITK